MKQRCIDAVEQAAGRDLKQTEVQGIEARIRKAYRQMAQDDQKAFLNMSEQERLDAAAKKAADDLKGEAAKIRQRVALTIAAHDRIQNYLVAQKARGISGTEALERRLRKFNDGKSQTSDVWYEGQARGNLFLSQMLTTLENTAPRAFGLFDNRQGVRAFLHEVYKINDPSRPTDSSAFLSDPKAVQAAKAGAREWLGASENARETFNRNGGEIGKLENWNVPQSWNQALVLKAGMKSFVDDFMPALDRRKYVNDDGTKMSDAQTTTFLQEAWKTIATGGANRADQNTGQGTGSLARRHAEERALHFKDPDEYLKLTDKYGRTDLFSSMVGHVQKIGKDIAMLQAFGPNPDHMFEFWNNKMLAEAANSGDTKTMRDAVTRAQGVKNLYDYVSGKSLPVANKWIAEKFDTWRNVLGSAMLGSAPFTAIKDFGNAAMTAAYNKMSVPRMIAQMVKNHNPVGYSDRMNVYRRGGLALDVYSSELNRWGKDAMGALWSKKLNNATHRLSGMVATDSAKRAATGTMMYSTIGEAAHTYKTLAEVPEDFRKILTARGVDENDFQVWRAAQKETWNGVKNVLTPEAIGRVPDATIAHLGDPTSLRDQAQVKLLAHALSEMDMVVPYTGAEHGKYAQGLQRGSLRDELTRSVLLFKGFALADMERHFIRGWNMPSGVGKAAYIAGFMGLSTILGALGKQLYEIVNGRDPQDMTGAKFWMGAALKGGGFGIYGDFLFNDQTQGGNSGFLDTLAGPQIASAQQLYDLTVGNAHNQAKGQKVDEGADLVRFAKSVVPMQNLWYTRAITDRLIFNNLKEWVSPGAMARVQAKAQSTFHQSYWWSPHENGDLIPAPQRGPDLGKAVGH